MQNALMIPATKIPRVGRELTPGGFSHLVSQLEEGEKLIGLYVRGRLWTAPWLHSAEEHRGFERHVTIGLAECIGYFALEEETFYELVTM